MGCECELECDLAHCSAAAANDYNVAPLPHRVVQLDKRLQMPQIEREKLRDQQVDRVPATP